MSSIEHARTALLSQLDLAWPSDNADRWLAVKRIVTQQPDPFSRERYATHVTVQAVVVYNELVLLHRHKKWGIWLCPGGHVDDDETAADAAVREVCEETGLDARHWQGGPLVVDVDVHEIPDGHTHYDVRYLMQGDGAPPDPEDGESGDAEWASWPDALRRGDESLRRSLKLAFAVVSAR